jgi:chromosome segregation ATPase
MTTKDQNTTTTEEGNNKQNSTEKALAPAPEVTQPMARTANNLSGEAEKLAAIGNYMQSAYGQLMADYDVLQLRFNEANTEISRLQIVDQQLRDTQHDLRVLQEKLKQANTDLTDTEAELEGSKKLNEAKDSTIKDLREREIVATGRAEKAEKDLSAATSDVIRLQTEHRKDNEILAIKAELVTKMEAEVAALTTERNKWRSRAQAE